MVDELGASEVKDNLIMGGKPICAEAKEYGEYVTSERGRRQRLVWRTVSRKSESCWKVSYSCEKRFCWISSG